MPLTGDRKAVLVVVETKEQVDGKRRYAINDFNKVKEEAFNIGSEQDFKNYIAGLKKLNQYPTQRGRISEAVYRKYIAMRKLNPMSVEETKNGETQPKAVKPAKNINILKFDMKSRYSDIYAEAKRLKFKPSTSKKSTKEALLQFLENYRNAKREAEERGFIQPNGRK